MTRGARRGRGPCCGRRRAARRASKPASAPAVACGFVAFESSTNRTPPTLADQLHAVRRGRRSRPASRATASASAPDLERGRGRGERVGDVVRRAATPATAASTPGGPTSVVAHARRSRRRAGSAGARSATTRAGAVGREAPRDRVVAVRPRAVVGALWWREDLAPSPRVGLDDAVPVEVVLGHVEQHRDVGRERVGRERELERRHLGDEHVDVVVDRVEQRAADVAGRGAARCPAPRSIAAISVVTVVLPLVPVTATTAARRVGRAGARPRGRSRSAPARPAPCGRDERGMVGAHAGLGTTRSAARPRRGRVAGVGRSTHARAPSAARAPRARRVRVAGAGAVLEHGDARGRRRACRHAPTSPVVAEPDHEDAHQSIAPGDVDEVGVEDAEAERDAERRRTARSARSP